MFFRQSQNFSVPAQKKGIDTAAFPLYNNIHKRKRNTVLTAVPTCGVPSGTGRYDKIPLNGGLLCIGAGQRLSPRFLYKL
jgi:hypothetical protein